MYNNYDYPAGADTPDAPWNEPVIPERDFDVTCSQSLSKTVTITTDNYIPGASGVDYEPDDEGGCCAVSWKDPDNTSDTNWGSEYASNGYKTPLELIQLFKETLEQQLKSWEGMGDEPCAKKEIHRIKHLIEECSNWTEDETEFIEE